MNSTGQQTRGSSDTGSGGRFKSADTKPGGTKDTGQATVPPGRTWLWFLGILLANYLLMRFFVPSPDAQVTVPYTMFKE
jgi:cell division protease FtsH